MVKFPNVDLLMEMADMREANRSYEANLQVIKQADSLNSMTLDLLNDTRSFEEFFMMPVLSVASSLLGSPAVSQALPSTQQSASVAGAGSDFGQVFSQVGEAINTLKAGESAAISGFRVRHRFNTSSSPSCFRRARHGTSGRSWVCAD
jgi:Flagellar basal body rod FlgEFG protein C-terminal